MKHRAYIRGRALACSLGEDIEQIISSIRRKESTVEQLPLTLARLPYRRPYYRLQKRGARDGVDLERYFYQVLFDTVEVAIADGKLTQEDLDGIGIFFGSTSVDIPIYESQYEKSDIHTEDMFSNDSFGYGSIVAKVASRFHIHGPCYTFTTACTSSANAFLYAASMIEQGMIGRALVIGYDLYNNTGFYGFEALKLMTPSIYRPLDKNRDGIIMGEGCGAVILDREKRAPDEFHYLGGANLCDTFNVTTHTEEGDFIAAVICQALANACLGPGDIHAIKAHATGSDNNDRTECNGMKKVFHRCLPPVTGIKSYIGHTVGASGVIELIITTESLKRGFLPATLGFVTPDEELGITPITDSLALGKGNIMLNYFGFGGNCTSLILSNKE